MDYKIQKARLVDSKFIYLTRNDKLSRKYSGNSNIIKYDEHLKWFKQKVVSKSNKFYVISKKNKKSDKISYVRFDKSYFFYKVSIGIKSNYRNKGHSSNILNLAEKQIKDNALLIAEVKPKNKPSYKLFKKNNYLLIQKHKNKLIFIKILEANNKLKNYLDTINKIELIRKNNNVNWMDILKVAFKNSPKQTSKIFSKISSFDNNINKLSKKLSS